MRSLQIGAVLLSSECTCGGRYREMWWFGVGSVAQGPDSGVSFPFVLAGKLVQHRQR